jgi:hypothetical protein
MTTPILLVCGCRAYEPYLHAAMRRFAHPAWTVVGLVGGAEEPTYDPATQILSVAAPDTYEALPRKIHAAFAWIRTTWPNAPGVFKTDDDILVRDLEALANAVTTHAAEPYWGLMVHRCHASYVPMTRIKHRFADKSFRPKHQSARYCFGHGYWLSAAALGIAVAASNDYGTSYLEDVCTGFVMNRAGWEPLSVPVPYKEMPRVPELLTFNREA